MCVEVKECTGFVWFSFPVYFENKNNSLEKFLKK